MFKRVRLRRKSADLKAAVVTNAARGGELCRRSFFHTLKTEWVMHCDYKTRDDARVSLFDYMEVFYNRQRRHSSIGYEAPLPFEAMQSPCKVSTVRGKTSQRPSSLNASGLMDDRRRSTHCRLSVHQRVGVPNSAAFTLRLCP